MDLYVIIAVVGLGFVAGFINTLAGSGSLLTLPFLMYLGLPANVANGTNRIAIFLQNIVGVASFKQQKALKISDGIWLAIPAVVGSVIGALFAVNLDEATMKNAIGLLLIIMFFLILFKPSMWIKGQAGKLTARPGIVQIIVFFTIGLYGGFIQAGVGLFLLAGLVLSAGFDLVKANAVKLLVILLYIPFTIAVFIINKQIDYTLGFTLAIGNMSGAFVASRFAVSWGAKFVRYILLIVIFIAALELLGLFSYIENIITG